MKKENELGMQVSYRSAKGSQVHGENNSASLSRFMYVRQLGTGAQVSTLTEAQKKGSTAQEHHVT